VVFRTTASPSLEFELYVLTPGREELISWEAIGLTPPDGMTPAEWQGILPALEGKWGTYWVGYLEALGDLATRLSRRGVPVESGREVFRFAVREAMGRPCAGVLGRLRASGDGMPLFGRKVLALQGGQVKSSATTDSEGSFASTGSRPAGPIRSASSTRTSGRSRSRCPPKEISWDSS